MSKTSKMAKQKKLQPDSAENVRDMKVRSDIAKYGLHVINVMEDEEHPPHSFSIGLFHNFKHPEIIIVGLKTELMQSMINWMGDEIREGKQLEVGKNYSGFLEGFDVTFGEMSKHHYKEYLGYALWFYQSYDFPVIQCIWPTTKGYFPWDKKYPKDLMDWQRLLDK